MAGKNRDDRSGQTDRPEEEDRLARAQKVHKIAAYKHQHHIWKAVDALQQSDIGVGKAELLGKQVSDRRDAVVYVVVAKHGKADQDKHNPAVGRRRSTTGRIRHEGSYPRSAVAGVFKE